MYTAAVSQHGNAGSAFEPFRSWVDAHVPCAVDLGSVCKNCDKVLLSVTYYTAIMLDIRADICEYYSTTKITDISFLF